jgi:hypothetical protein
MRNFGQINKLFLLLGLLATILFPNNLATLNLPPYQSVRVPLQPRIQTVRNIVSLSPRLASIVETNAVQDKQTIVPIDVVREMLGNVNKDRAVRDLRRLTGEEQICIGSECHTIANRLTGSQGLHWVKDYIYQELVRLGYSVEFQDWSSSGYVDQNIIARKPGRFSPDETIYLVAHLDGIGSDGEDRFPAADDDGSGAVDLLEMARVLSTYSFSRTIVLFFSTGEEEGTLGAQSYLNQITPEELSSIKYVIDVDMVGYDGNNDAGMELWHGGQPSSMAVTEIMSNTIAAYQIGLKPAFVTGCG